MDKKIISILFFLSGLCGLIYEILWTRQFSFVLGNTYLAISIIVASFMFGLYLGSWLIGKFIDKCQNEIKWYAFLELIIGAYALFLLFTFDLTNIFFHGLYATLGGTDFLYSSGKFIITLLFLVIPTSAMGATLPLIVHYYTKNKKYFGDNISLFYALNTIGGAIGVLAAGFYLIEHVGIQGSLMLTAGINILIGIIVLVVLKISRKEIKEEAHAEETHLQAHKRKSAAKPVDKKIQLLYLLAACLAGLAALAYQIIWIRGVKFLIHNSTYSFSVVLFVFLLGIALGSSLNKIIIKKWNHLEFIYGLLQMVLGIYCLFTIYLLYDFSYSNFFQTNLINIIYDYSYNWLWAIAIYAIICSLIFLLPTTIMGVCFP